MYNQLAESGEFPKNWKKSRLVLLRKGNKPIENPSSYRPICLPDVEGKLFEQLILIWLKEEILRTGGLAVNQYGFREGRKTVDTIKEVVTSAEQSAAFSNVCWQNIFDNLRKRGIDESLINLVASYLSEREVIIEVWLRTRTLILVPEKTEAVILTRKRKVGLINFQLQDIVIRPSEAIKYLGVWLDTKGTYSEHLDRTVEKAEKNMTALTGLMPNIGGPRPSKRHILVSVVQSQLLYAAPIWHKALRKRHLRRKLERVQKLAGIRVASAYRTVSTEGIGVIAEIPPIELLAQERFANIRRKTAE
ncbi:uncharacterized protein LOC117178675 [Belonocnema kinseyi]|uniref:uncharacterized protein LOC117178675 n=1 Tax=Belonocnema kinseyi TaxID=2817044 RepID=UPI00143D62DB|nr:uncharacterized protein LOC117178675 [Belonocnema kinseyi]